MAVPSSSMALADVPGTHASLRPESVALVAAGDAMSYRELAHACDSAARVLWHDWGVRPGDRVAWLGANHRAQLILLFALARIGAMLLPLNFRLAPAEWQLLLAGCGASHLVHDASFESAALGLSQRVDIRVRALDTLTADSDGAPAPSLGKPDAPVLLVYTSGATGEPKAAVHTQANLLANMAIASHVQRMSPGDVVATMLPMFHVGGLCIQTLPALYAGARVILHPRFSADAAMGCFEQDRPTLTLQVPATMKALIEHPRWREADLTSLRAVWAGSSLLPEPLVQAFHARGLKVCNVYGATETGPFSVALPPEQSASHAGSCGWPAPGVEVRLAGAQAGVGELLIRGPNVVATYWPAQPARDEEGWFHTGDLASRAEDGSYTVAGRAKDLIISGGENIHPVEIESLLMQHPGVGDCAAFGLPDEVWGEVVAVAVVRSAQGAGVSEEELLSHLGARLARFKLPRRWFWVDELPKTALGKLQRQALVARLAPAD